MRDETRRNLRIGVVVLAALTVLATGIFIIGKRQQLFIRHTRYYTVFRDVLGLRRGAPVELNGVTVGFVEAIELPTDPTAVGITVRFKVDSRFTDRIREDTVASIKTVGLLGDRYLKLAGGSPDRPRVLEGGRVTGQNPAELEHFLTGGEDLMENLLAISSSLRVILENAERGRGLLGQLLAPSGEGRTSGEDLMETIADLREIVRGIKEGRGLLGRLVADDELGARLFDDLGSTARAIRDLTETISADLGREDTAWSALVRDPEGARLVAETLASLHQASQALAAAGTELATGRGTLPRLLGDREYADDFLDDLQGLVHALRSVADKLDRGDGTAGAFINDPQMYRDLENIVRGVRNSSLTSWYIRNRRRAGEMAEREEAYRRLVPEIPPTPVVE